MHIIRDIQTRALKADQKIKELQTILDTNTLLTDNQRKAITMSIAELATPSQPPNFVCPECLKPECDGISCEQYDETHAQGDDREMPRCPECDGISHEHGEICARCDAEEQEGIDALEDERQNL